MSFDSSMKNLGDIIRRNAAKYPDRLGVVSGERRLTWDELNKRVNRLANCMIAAGVTKGGAVACLTRNRHELVETLFAANKIGAIYVPINIRLAPAEIKFIIEDSEAQALVFDPAFAEAVNTILPDLKSLKLVLCMQGGMSEFKGMEQALDSSQDSEPVIEVTGEEVATIAYTSGTTGFPKGVMSTHFNYLSTAADYPFDFSITFQENYLLFVPIMGAGALSALYNGLYGASKMVLMDFDAEKILQTIEKESINISTAVPIMFTRLIDVPGSAKYDMSSLKYMMSGASPFTVPVLKRCKEFFKCEFQSNLGMTETGGIVGTTLTPWDLVIEGGPEKLARVSSVGRARKGMGLKVVNDDGVEVKPGGEVGEIAISGPCVMKGYWKNPAATAAVLKDGWYFTGDLGWIDNEGYVFLVDRKHDTIKTGGSNVYPVEVEQVLIEHPAIEEVAVIGVPDEAWGEAVAAVVYLKRGVQATEKELIDFCTDKIGGFKKPKKVIFITEPLPRNALGKILRKDLRKAYS